MTTDQIIEVVTAFKNGKKIQYRHKHDKHAIWRDCGSNIAWQFWDVDYRVKPEPMELWVNVYDDGSGIGYTNEASALNRAGTYFARKAVLFREVIGADVKNGDK